MRALEFIIGHVIYNPAYTYKFQLKTTLNLLKDAPYSKDKLSCLKKADIMWSNSVTCLVCFHLMNVKKYVLIQSILGHFCHAIICLLVATR